MRVIDGPEALREAAGEELGVSEWVTVTQDEVDAFADLTHDHQWIHVDAACAGASPFGSTIVHGFFTLALAPRLQDHVYRIDGFGYGLNYGLNKLRFPAPLPVGTPVRLKVTLDEVRDVSGGLEVSLTNVFEREGCDKPVCVAQQVVRVYTGAEG